MSSIYLYNIAEFEIFSDVYIHVTEIFKKHNYVLFYPLCNNET